MSQCYIQPPGDLPTSMCMTLLTSSPIPLSKHASGPMGRSLHIAAVKCQGYPDVFNGVRHLRIAFCVLAASRSELSMRTSLKPAGSATRLTISLKNVPPLFVTIVMALVILIAIVLRDCAVVSVNQRSMSLWTACTPGIAAHKPSTQPTIQWRTLLLMCSPPGS